MKIGFSQHYDGPGGARSWIKGFSHYCIHQGHTVSYGYDPTVDVFCSVANLSTPLELQSLKDKNIKILQRLGAIYLPYNHPNAQVIQNKNNELKTLIDFADAIVYQSHFSKEYLFRSIYNQHEPDGEIIYNCADDSLFHPYGNKLSRPTDKKVILAAAYWGTPHTATHSMDILMQVIKHYEYRNDLTFWVLGRAFPPHEQMLRDAHFKNISWLDLLHPIDRTMMPDLLRTVDMVLHLKAHEGCSNMVIETLHTGTPLVGLHSGSLPELIGDSALLASCSQPLQTFPTVDLQDLIQKIDRTLEQQGSISATMLSRAKNFTPSMTYERYLNKLIQLHQSSR
ncbi:MAG: glycosyltransferase [Cellulosilyticaceae bacterium]